MNHNTHDIPTAFFPQWSYPSVRGGQALLEYADLLRMDANRKLPLNRKSTPGQYMTSIPLARYMASLLTNRPPKIRLLDAGSGTGALMAALTAEACAWENTPCDIHLTAYELDPLLAGYSRRMQEACGVICQQRSIAFSARVVEEDFLSSVARQILRGAVNQTAYTTVLLNPPYGKLSGQSELGRLLKAARIEVSNRYAAFVWLATILLVPEGEMVAILPRSFCSGAYFRRFRRAFLETMSLSQVHLFTSRDRLFQEDQVLQEQVIIRAIKSRERPEMVSMLASSSEEITDDLEGIDVAYDDVVRPGDPDKVIRIVTDALSLRILHFFDH